MWAIFCDVLVYLLPIVTEIRLKNHKSGTQSFWFFCRYTTNIFYFYLKMILLSIRQKPTWLIVNIWNKITNFPSSTDHRHKFVLGFWLWNCENQIIIINIWQSSIMQQKYQDKMYLMDILNLLNLDHLTVYWFLKFGRYAMLHKHKLFCLI